MIRFLYFFFILKFQFSFFSLHHISILSEKKHADILALRTVIQTYTNTSYNKWTPLLAVAAVQHDKQHAANNNWEITGTQDEAPDSSSSEIHIKCEYCAETSNQ